MGSGGSFVGQILAERLGLKFIDREVLHQCAESFGVDNALLTAREERLTTFWEKLFGGITLGAPDGPYTPPPLRPFNDRELFERQVEVLNRMAREEDTVIVGWAGALVLPPSPGLVNIYLHAPVAFRVERVMEVYKTPTREKARQAIAESDRRRKLYFNEMTGKDWACADNYHLSVDSSLMPLPDLAELLLVFIERKIGLRPPTG
jgi:cytidylate kinase